MDKTDADSILDALLRNRCNRIGFCVGRQHSSVSFGELYRRVCWLAGRMSGSGVSGGDGVAVVMENSLESVLVDLALLKTGATSIHLPDGSYADIEERIGSGRVRHLLVHESETDRVSSARFELVASGLMGTALYRCRTEPSDSGVLQDSPAMIFSSGTSGRIKKILVNPKAVLHNARRFFATFARNGDDSFLVFLPLSNYQQKLLIYGCIVNGIDICVSDSRSLLSALKGAVPTLFLAPPIFYESMWKATLSSSEEPGGRHAALRRSLGGRMRLAWSGMAPIEPGVLSGYRSAGIPVLEAYGMTEYGPICTNRVDRDRVGSVGLPIDAGSVELAHDGEVVVSSNFPLTLGYVDETPEDTAAVYTDGSRIRTGDIGHFDDDGYLYLEGRKNEIITLSSGHKIHPRVIEEVFARLDYVAQAVVTSHRQVHLELILSCPQGGSASEREEVERLVDGLNVGSCRDHPIRHWQLVTEEFTVENELLTRNFKLRRDRIRERYGRPAPG